MGDNASESGFGLARCPCSAAKEPGHFGPDDPISVGMPLAVAAEASLGERVRQGDPKAFEALYEEYTPAISLWMNPPRMKSCAFLATSSFGASRRVLVNR